MKKSLGKGLDALFGSEIENQIQEISNNSNNNMITELKLSQIEPNINQPRKDFDEEKIAELAESIKSNGLIQPIVVSKDGNTYKIIAGERRWRAARVAGLKTVPVYIKENIKGEKLLELALIENLQRQDLNSIEEANAYQSLINEYGMTQEQVANVIGKSRPKIANSVRLLNLDERVQEMLISGRISEAHARAIIPVEKKDKQYELALLIEKKGLSVREIEMLMRNKKKAGHTQKKEDIFTKNIEESMKSYLGTKVKIVPKSKEKGKIVIEYFSNDDLDRIMDIIGMDKAY
jgi:ParB family chromosome partitioning protein